MRYTAISKETNKPVSMDSFPQGHPPSTIKFQYLPRIKCKDCPGKLYPAGPGHTIDNFGSHLSFKPHKERVEARIRRTSGNA
jgi:SWI/SNF-related matrix-associated actin-dependent regulator of chromatin subfamily B member 1